VVIRVTPQPPRGRSRVSVVVPCYQYGHYLAECVHSVLDQTGVEVDVTVIDDASSDDTAEVGWHLAAEDPRVRLVVHETNQGHIATFNEGLAGADGDYVVLLSADDLLAPGALARAAALLDAHPDVGLVYGFTRTFSTATQASSRRGVRRTGRALAQPPAATEVPSWSIWSGPEWLELICRRVTNPIYTPEVVMRNAVMRDLVGYDPRVPHAADFLMWLRAASRGSIGRVNGVDQAYYRIHGHNMHLEAYPGALRDLRERNRCFEILFEELGEAMPANLRRAARAGIAREALVVAGRAHRDGPPPADQADMVEQLVAFAEELDPPTRHGRHGRAYDAAVARARAGRRPLVPPRLTALRDRAVRHVRFRRWRATGIDAAAGST
jgi:glycosyltransferase involved in cell wall biosynthesis